MKKKILFLASKKHVTSRKKRVHYGWTRDEDCLKKFDISFWGPGYTGDLSLDELKMSINALKTFINKIRPDYIYCYNRSKISQWLPDLSSIKVPKIMVELDTYKHDPNNSWYKQFDELYCRIQDWDQKNIEILGAGSFPKRKLYNKYKTHLILSQKWKDVKLLRWSIKKSNIFTGKSTRNRIRFLGKSDGDLYPTRIRILETYRGKIKSYKKKIFDPTLYNEILRSSTALLCPAESIYGDFVPAKMFEFSASGAAILTNCDLISYNMKDLDEVVIKYTSFDDLKEKLDMDFSKYYNKASEVMRNHTHDIRYSEIFV